MPTSVARVDGMSTQWVSAVIAVVLAGWVGGCVALVVESRKARQASLEQAQTEREAFLQRQRHRRGDHAD